MSVAEYSIRGQRCSIATVYIASPPPPLHMPCGEVSMHHVLNFFHHQTYQIKLHFSFLSDALSAKTDAHFSCPGTATHYSQCCFKADLRVGRQAVNTVLCKTCCFCCSSNDFSLSTHSLPIYMAMFTWKYLPMFGRCFH